MKNGSLLHALHLEVLILYRRLGNGNITGLL